MATTETKDTDHDAHASRSEAPDGLVTTLMIQNVLAEPEWANVLGEAEQSVRL